MNIRNDIRINNTPITNEKNKEKRTKIPINKPTNNFKAKNMKEKKEERINIGTLNVHTLKSEMRLIELLNAVKETNW